MPDWATSGRVKIERANEHIRELERRTAGFVNSAPYDLVVHEDFEARQTVFTWHRLAHTATIDPMWGAIAADAIHNLRSALDILWHHATVPPSGKTGRRSRAYFPFPDSSEELKTRLLRVKQPAIKAALQIVQSFEPHQGGTTRLWLLNQAWQRDKHEVPLLATLAFVKGQIALTPPPGFRDDGFGFVMNVRFPERGALVDDGKVFFRDDQRRRLDPDHQHKFTFQIAFGEGWPFEGEAVLETLNYFAGVTNAVAEAFIRAGLLT
jgi:hypothetical protein